MRCGVAARAYRFEAGEDNIYGVSGNDGLWGGTGGDVDRLFGNGGDDYLDVHDGYTGTDLANGGDGADRCRIDVNAYNPDQHDMHYYCEPIVTVQIT